MPLMMTPVDRHAFLLDRLADHVLAHGLLASSLRPLARAAGISDRMLLYYFPDKDAVVSATLEHLAARLTVLLEGEVVAQPLPLARLERHLRNVLLAPSLWPYMRLWLEIASRAASGDALYRRVGAAIGRGFLEWGAAQLECPTQADREVDAARLLVAIEGAMLLKSLGLDDLLTRLD